MPEKRVITIRLGGKEFKMNVPVQDEEKYRKAASDINTLIDAYKKTFRAEPDDYLAMAALQTAVLKVEMEMSRDLSSDKEMLKALDTKLGEYLDSIKK